MCHSAAGVMVLMKWGEYGEDGGLPSENLIALWWNERLLP